MLCFFWGCLTGCCASCILAARAQEAEALLSTYTEQQQSSQRQLAATSRELAKARVQASSLSLQLTISRMEQRLEQELRDARGARRSGEGSSAPASSGAHKDSLAQDPAGDEEEGRAGQGARLASE